MATPERDGQEALRADMERIRKDVEALTETLKTVAGNEGAALLKQAREAADAVRDKGETLSTSVADQVREKPLIAVLSVFVVGLILGLLFSRRS